MATRKKARRQTTRSKSKKHISAVKSRILRKIAREIKSAGGPASVGHSKGDHLSSVFIKNPK